MGPFKDGWTEADVETVLGRGDPAELLYVPIIVSLDPPEGDWAEEVCIRLAAHADGQTRANAILGFGHLACTAGALDEARVRPLVEAAFKDEDARVRAHAEDAASDIRMFLKWKIGG
jgi:hypothetical protein